MIPTAKIQVRICVCAFLWPKIAEVGVILPLGYDDMNTRVAHNKHTTAVPTAFLIIGEPL